MEKTTIKLQCPKCGRRLVATVNKGMNIALAKIRCAAEKCGYIGRGVEFMSPRFNSDNENHCPKCGAIWRTKSGSKEILVCPQCDNSENIIQQK